MKTYLAERKDVRVHRMMLPENASMCGSRMFEFSAKRSSRWGNVDNTGKYEISC
jgi:hypothetical protein